MSPAGQTRRTTAHPHFGTLLALFGVLVLTPDTLFMRLSEMGGLEMLAWRGLLMGAVLLPYWYLFGAGSRRLELAALLSGPGLVVVVCYFVNSTLFSLGIAAAPVLIVLLGVSAVPVFAAVFAYLLIGEPTRRSTWMAIATVLTGIAIAVFSRETTGIGINRESTLGALAGLGVGIALALSFVVIRKRRDLPVPLAIGLGALLSGSAAATVAGPGALSQGNLWAIAVCGALILPVSFVALTTASRYTNAANVSLILLLETILGPLWVWYFVGETPTAQMLLGGAIVLAGLGVYLVHDARRRQRKLSPSLP